MKLRSAPSNLYLLEAVTTDNTAERVALAEVEKTNAYIPLIIH